MAEATNRVSLSGWVADSPETRWTPAGLELTRFSLVHRSRATIAGLERTVECQITVVALGESLAQTAQALVVDQGCAVEGVLSQRVSRRTGREPFYGRFELQALSLTPLPPEGKDSE